MNTQYRRIRQYVGMYLAALMLVLSLIAAGPGSANAQAAGCMVPLGTDAVSNASIIDRAYRQWKAAYVTSSGAGGDLRVQRSGPDNYDTVSEGIAYGMLFAVYSNDKDTFDGLWAYAQKHMNGNGVMNWRIAADGSTTGHNGATDADEDMAAALIAADTSWGGYRASALKLIDTIKRYEVEQGTYIVKPGDVWGGSGVLNPSYLAPSYYDLFQAYTGDSEWAKVKAASYRVLQAAQNRSTGLVPDWSTSTGAPAPGMSYDYGYDASRAPLRLALSVAWSCDTTAAKLLTPVNQWFAGKDLSRLASSYALDGTANGDGDTIPLLAAAASAASASANGTYRMSAWNTLVGAPSTSYYPDSMRLFSLMVAGGTMVSPLDVPQRQPTTPIAPSRTLEIMGTDATLNADTVGEVSLGFAAPKQQGNLVIDLEVYDKNGRKVAQQVYENQTLTMAAKRYRLQWTPETTGEYVLKGGIFSAGWAQNLQWNDRAAVITVMPASATPQPSSSPTSSPTPSPLALASVSIWWPGGSQPLAGTQPFKAVVAGMSLADYDMFWQVDNGRLNEMDSVYDSAPHKESLVDLGGWRWSADGRYTITFVAKNKSGSVITQKSTVIALTY